MWIETRYALLGLLLAGVANAQPTQEKPADSNSGARELFYIAGAPKDELPSIRRGAGSKASTAKSAVKNLGIRYNLLLVDPANRGTPIDSGHIFKNGDSVALQIESNRSGYLYVLARQSSGNWLPLLPSPEMPDESNIINPGKPIRVPANYSFDIQNPPGSEHLVLVFSRDPQDFYDLYQEIRNRPSTGTPPRRPSPATQIADASPLDKTVSKLEENFGTRDIGIRRVDKPMRAGEPAGSVYVVSTSNKPTSSVVTEIEIRHR